jgi:hypothetical protein
MKSPAQKWNEAHRDKVHATQKRYRTKHRALVTERTKQWAHTPNGLKSCRNSQFKRKYGITLEHYENLLANQNGVCAICGNPPTDKRLSIDHCHATKKIRGLLCYRCNTGLASFHDNESLLWTAYHYIAQTEGKQP